MKRLLLLVALISLTVGGEAAAQIDPDPDGIGIYADQSATVNAITAEPGVPIEAYLVLTRQSGTLGMIGWEAKLVIPENVTIWGWNVPGTGWFNYGSPPEFGVAYAQPPLPPTPAQVLMTFIIVAADAAPAQFYITHTSINSGGYDLPVYIDASNINIIKPLHPWPDGPTEPSFTVNGTLVATRSETWTRVKTLYR
ncbi:MAG: hypothetical protein ACYDIE_08555 [Candidatus Krumholzibacteriia bacterium]